MRFVAWLAPALVAVALSWTVTVAAQTPQDEARTHEAQGEAYFAAENFDAALVEFQSVYDLLEGSPSRYLVLFNIGQCQERLFRYDDALRSYQHYLDEGGPEAEDRATVEATSHALDGMLATLTIEANVEDAEVWVDDRLLGTAPGVVRVPPGNHSIELRAPEHSPGRQQVEVATHASRTMTFTLELLGQPSGIHPAFFFTGLAATAIALGIGIGFGVDAMTTSAYVSRQSASMNAAEYGSVYGGDLAHIRDLTITADALYGVAGALAIGTFVMLLVTDWGGGVAAETPATALRVMPTISTTQLGLQLGGAF